MMAKLDLNIVNFCGPMKRLPVKKTYLSTIGFKSLPLGLQPEQFGRSQMKVTSLWVLQALQDLVRRDDPMIRKRVRPPVFSPMEQPRPVKKRRLTTASAAAPSSQSPSAAAPSPSSQSPSAAEPKCCSTESWSMTRLKMLMQQPTEETSEYWRNVGGSLEEMHRMLEPDPEKQTEEQTEKEASSSSQCPKPKQIDVGCSPSDPSRVMDHWTDGKAHSAPIIQRMAKQQLTENNLQKLGAENMLMQGLLVHTKRRMRLQLTGDW